MDDDAGEAPPLNAERVAFFNERLAPIAFGRGFKLRFVRIADVEDAPVNARFMRSREFQALVSNIRKDGALSSVPLVWERPKDGKLQWVSGHHRTKAGGAAGVEYTLAIVIDWDMSRPEEVARQLSHNAISGQDDLSVLKSLWDEIDDVDFKVYAGLDDKVLEGLADFDLRGLTEEPLDLRQVVLLFTPSEIEHLDALVERLEMVGEQEKLYVAIRHDFDRLITALTQARKSYGVKNAATAMGCVLDVFERHLEDLREGWLDEEGEPHKGHGVVPLASVLGTPDVDAKLAARLHRFVEQRVTRGDVPKTEKWRALEVLLDGAE